MIRYATLALLSMLALASCAGAGQDTAACAADPAHWARTPQGCLAIHTYGPPQAEVLVVVLHGDVSSGGPARYHLPIARRIAETLPGTATVALIRPGYPDGEGRISDGDAYARFDHYTPENIALVAQAIDRLRARAGARQVIAVGHSGGAATIADVLALHPGTINSAILLGCACDLATMRRNRRPWTGSIDPITVADRVPTTTRIAAYTGTADTVTIPDLSQNYVDRLTARGIQARFTRVPLATHNGLVDAIWTTDIPTIITEFARPQ